MDKIKFLLTLTIISVSLFSCNTSHISNNYLKQDFKVSTTKTYDNVSLLKAKLEKPIIMPESLNLTENLGLWNRLKSVDYVSEVDVAVSNIINEANSYLGTPYRYGGTTRRGIDCSAFMQKIFNVADINLPRVSNKQAKIGVFVAKDNLQKGDLVFFSTTSRYRVTHVGMVINVEEDGNVEFIHAASSQGVSIASLSNPYWNSRYRLARRPNKFIEGGLVENSRMLVSVQ